MSTTRVFGISFATYAARFTSKCSCHVTLATQDALDKSMSYDYGGPEPLHAMANLRLSQSRHEEAVQSAEEAFRRLETCGEHARKDLSCVACLTCRIRR